MAKSTCNSRVNATSQRFSVPPNLFLPSSHLKEHTEIKLLLALDNRPKCKVEVQSVTVQKGRSQQEIYRNITFVGRTTRSAKNFQTTVRFGSCYREESDACGVNQKDGTRNQCEFRPKGRRFTTFYQFSCFFLLSWKHGQR